MSDFDKEAEREKLREKYGEEEEKRAATEQMSELLLKGATMTNAHCTDCGDPIFRYDGQEFCPTCQKPVARDQSEDSDEADGDHIEVADPSNDATVQFGGDERADSETEADGQPSATDAEQPSPEPETQPSPGQSETQSSPAPSEAQQPLADTGGEIPSADPDRTPASNTAPTAPTERRPTRQSSQPSAGTDAVESDLSAAESLLAQTVHRFARQAAETDDPRRARDHLAAAREAAEALDAVRF